MQFHPNPLRIQIFVRSKGIHAKFYAPNAKNGATAEVIEGKGDIWGETDRRVRPPKKRQEAMEHGEFLSAIQRAVAGL